MDNFVQNVYQKLLTELKNSAVFTNTGQYILQFPATGIMVMNIFGGNKRNTECRQPVKPLRIISRIVFS